MKCSDKELSVFTSRVFVTSLQCTLVREKNNSHEYKARRVILSVPAPSQTNFTKIIDFMTGLRTHIIHQLATSSPLHAKRTN